jgi:hypothetical protein
MSSGGVPLTPWMRNSTRGIAPAFAAERVGGL